MKWISVHEMQCLFHNYGHVETHGRASLQPVAWYCHHQPHSRASLQHADWCWYFQPHGRGLYIVQNGVCIISRTAVRLYVFLSFRPGRKPPSLRLELPLGAEPCGGGNLPFRSGRKLAPEKNHVSARSGSSLFRNFAFPPEAEGRTGKISYFRPRRKAVINRSF